MEFHLNHKFFGMKHLLIKLATFPSLRVGESAENIIYWYPPLFKVETHEIEICK